MGLYKDKGWDYLTSDSQDENSYYDDDGSWGYRNEDGSGSYHGADGSWGYINSDGSGSYYGADGSWGYINSDGSSSYFEGDKNEENADESYDEESEDDTNATTATTAGNGIAALLGFAIGFGVPTYMAYKNAKHEEERKEAEKRIEEERIRKEKLKKRKIRNRRLKALLFNKKNIKTDVSADALVGNYVEYVTERIKEAGFTNYEAIPIKDICEGSNKKVGEVEQVVINGQSCFDANTMFSYKDKIIISYHVKREIPFPISSKQSGKMTYENLMKELHELGYTEIYTEKIADLVTGWMHKDGSVEYVLVNGKTKYRKGDMFDYDVKIVIAYHTFAKKI